MKSIIPIKLFPLFILFGFVIYSCSESNDPVSTNNLSDYEKSVLEYFKEIALGMEFGYASEVTRKWKGGMKIFVDGNPDD